MPIPGEPKSKKRRRNLEVPPDDKGGHPSQIYKSLAQSQPPLRKQRPSSFWDTLSRVRLTRGALREFDRRNARDTSQSCSATVPAVEHSTAMFQQRLKQLSRRGGFDLSHLRGFASNSRPLAAMRQSRVCGGRKNRLPSSRKSATTKTQKTTTYSGNFEQKLIDIGVYLNNKASKPHNLLDICEAIRQPRASLSPSRFKTEDFEKFQELANEAPSEAIVMSKILPIIAGDEGKHHFSTGDICFGNLDLLDKDLCLPKPDMYYGARPSEIHPQVRADLGKRIIPSTLSSRPAAPNFFMEGKGVDGRVLVANRQACYDGAIGARAMHELQNYGVDEPMYDNNAYSFSTTYFAGNNTLQIYSTHVTPPAVPGGRPEYHMTEIDGYMMKKHIGSFREGATAYRNIRDLAKQYRDRFITKANERVCNISRTSRRLMFKTTHRDGLQEEESALDNARSVKRPKSLSKSNLGRYDLRPRRHHCGATSTRR